jgi:hypothetical protein
MAAYGEVLGDADAMNGLFGRFCIRAHVEITRGDNDKFRAIRAIAKQLSGESPIIGPCGACSDRTERHTEGDDRRCSQRRTTHELAP